MSAVVDAGEVYLTPKDAATYVRRAEKTLEEWRSLKKGPLFIKIGPSKKGLSSIVARTLMPGWQAISCKRAIEGRTTVAIVTES